jgi:thiamine pyrophosphate-dependent acetolactate synthase large subunit-like protein
VLFGVAVLAVRLAGKAGVAWATSGPGATNLVTGIANACMDSVPVVCITGAVITALLGRDGFQEADITGITIPITKYNNLVLNVAEIPRVMREAFYIATTGRPGPVLVDIPRDVLQQRAEFVWPEKVELRGYRPRIYPDPAEVTKAAELIQEARRPVIIAGASGCGKSTILNRFVQDLLEADDYESHRNLDQIHPCSDDFHDSFPPCTSSAISRTASWKPTAKARATTEKPMLSSTTSGISATGLTFP